MVGFAGYEDGAAVLEVFLDAWEVDVGCFVDFDLFAGVVAEEHDLVGWGVFGFWLD